MKNVVQDLTSGGLAAVSSSFFAALCSAFGRYDVVHVEVKHLVDIKRVFSISLKKWVAGIVMFLCVKVSNEICNTSVLGLTFLILEGTIIYIITLLVLRDEFFCNMIKKLFCKVKGILAH